MTKIRNVIIITLVILALALMAFPSCRFFREVNKTADVEQETQKADSGSVKTAEGKTATDTKWEREIKIYDTAITNNIFHPTTIIRERGETQERTEYKNTDSVWIAVLIEALKSKTTEETKTEAKPPGLFAMIGIIIVIGVIIYIALRVTIKRI